MRIIDFPGGPSRSIERFESTGVALDGAVRFEGGGGWTFLSFEPVATLGRHPAVVDQLFVVLEGNGWVAGEDGVRIPIEAGQAAWWTAGEHHESGSAPGMRVAVLEAEAIRVPMRNDVESDHADGRPPPSDG